MSDRLQRAGTGIVAAGVGEVRVDLVVAGAGAAGLACAIAAHDSGASVAVLDKYPMPQGNTVLSSASVPAAGTRFQRAAGIEDSAERFEADLRRRAGPIDNEALIGVLARVSAPLVEWLADTVGIAMDVITEYRHVGHSVPRLHAPTPRRGQVLLQGLQDAAERRDIPVLFENRVTALQWDGERVCGVEVLGGTASAHRIDAGAVVLATNGFAANAAMRGRYCPETLGFEYAGAPGSQGEAIEWGVALGARLDNIGAYQAHASYAVPHGVLATWTLVEKGGIVVDRNGRRFGDESLGYSGFAAASAAAGQPQFVIYDARIRELSAAGQPEFAELVAHGGAIEAPDVAALATRIGVDPAALAQSLAQAGGAAPDPFGRVEHGLAPLEPPLCATRVTTAILHTQGGLAVDASARVLRADRSVIPGLYAAGGAAAGISGRAGPGGYSSGNGLLAALGLGWIAGRALAASLGSPRASYLREAGSA
ncbi:MAG: FAD-binding protein [Burkholderiales bacterium]|nr:MAG: FAD-binding protein [Burkholderiales bacterium]